MSGQERRRSLLGCRRSWLSVSTPAARGEPVEPPFLVRFVLVADFRSEVAPGWRDRGKRLQANGSAKPVHAIRIGDGPGTREAVAWIVDGLRAEALRAAFIKRDAIFEIGGMPGRDAALFDAVFHEAQGGAHEFGFADGVLHDEPGSFGAVGSGKVGAGPAVVGDDLSESRSIFDVNGFHAGVVGATEFAGGEEFFAEGEVIVAEREELAAERVKHGRLCITAEEATQRQRSGRSVFAGRQERHWADPPKPGNHEPRANFVTVLLQRKAVVEVKRDKRKERMGSIRKTEAGVE